MDDAGFQEHVTQEVHASFVVPFVRQAGRRVIDLEVVQTLNIEADICALRVRSIVCLNFQNANMAVAARSAREWIGKLIFKPKA